MPYSFTVLHLIDDYALSPEAYRLYFHIVRMASNGIVPYCTTDDSLTTQCNLSITKLSEAKKELEENGLIKIVSQLVDGTWMDSITLIDLIKMNDSLYSHHSIDVPEDLRKLAFVNALDVIKKERRNAVSVRPRSPGYIYLVRSETGYKIGKAIDVNKRLKQLRTGTPFLELLHTIPTQNTSIAESNLHAKFKDKRRTGGGKEWFDLTDEDVSWLCSLKTYDPE